MSRPERHGAHYSFADFVAYERASPEKHEWLDGAIYAMAGGTPQHAALAARVVALLERRPRTDGPCTTFTADLGIRVQATGLATYPDVTVVCGSWETDPESDQHVTNPTILVEVTSPSSELYDRGEKREHYLTIPSLRAYVVVSHREPRLDAWLRDGATAPWRTESAGPDETLALPGDPVPLRTAELYRDIPL